MQAFLRGIIDAELVYSSNCLTLGWRPSLLGGRPLLSETNNIVSPFFRLLPGSRLQTPKQMRLSGHPRDFIPLQESQLGVESESNATAKARLAKLCFEDLCSVCLSNQWASYVAILHVCPPTPLNSVFARLTTTEQRMNLLVFISHLRNNPQGTILLYRTVRLLLVLPATTLLPLLALCPWKRLSSLLQGHRY